MTGGVRRSLIWSVACCVALLGSLTFAGTASAHAVLVSSSPAPSAVLASSPTQILLTFDESVDLVVNPIRVVDAAGAPVNVGRPGHPQGPASIGVSVPVLADGTYVVAWQAISADSHPISGAFTFSVRSQTQTAPGLVDRLIAGQSPNRVDESGLAVGRWLSYGGLAVLLGVFIVLAVCDHESLSGRRTRALLAIGAGIGALGSALMIAFQGALSGGGLVSPTAWRGVADSHAGRWWIVRLGVFLAGLALPAIARRYRRDGPWPAVIVFYTAVLLGVTTVGGHAASGRWIPLAFAATAVHLGAMALWLGGLTAIAFAVPAQRRRAAASSFSRVALWSVIALAVTGVLNAWRQTSSFSALTGSTYGTWLIIKLVVVLAVVIVAWFTRSNMGRGDDDTRHPLRRLLTVEVVGIAIVLGVTIGLVSSVPPRVAVAAPASVSAVQGNRIAQVVLDPPVTGGTVMHVYLSSTTGSLDAPTSITVAADLPSKQISGLQLKLQDAGPGHLTAGDVDLPVAGTWTIVVTARYSEFDQTVFRLQVGVR